jgi:hypothetical protein
MQSTTATCPRCGFDFHTEKIGTGRAGGAKSCAECRPAVRLNRYATRPTPVLVVELASQVASLRMAIETARRRLGMGIHGSRCGRDSLIESMHDADGLLDQAEQAYQVLAGSRVEENRDASAYGGRR